MPVLCEPLNELQKDALKEIANIGAGHAMMALGNMTGETYNMSVPRIGFQLLSDYPPELGDPESPAAAVFMPVDGDAPGHAAFVLSYSSAIALTNLLLGKNKEDENEMGDIENSALSEVGNILISSFLNAVSEMTGLTLSASPPGVAVDMGGAIIASIVSITDLEWEQVLAITTRMDDIDHPIEGVFLFIPEPSSLPILFKSLGME